MYAGHAGMGLALAGIARDGRRGPVAWLVLASLAADIGWCLLTLAGIEGGHSMGSQALHAPRLPWSHSVLSTAVLSLAFVVAVTALRPAMHRGRLALLVALAVWIHLVIGDLPFGEAFPLAPWTPPLRTPHLYASWPLALTIEAFVVAAGVAVVAARTWGWRRGRLAMGLLLGLHVFSWLPTFVGRPTVDLDASRLPIVGYLMLLLAAQAVCVWIAPANVESGNVARE